MGTLSKETKTSVIRVLQVYDSTVANAGINIEIMNWFRNIDRNEFQFDFLSTWKRYPNFDEEIKKLGGNSFYISEKETIGNPIVFVKRVKNFMVSYSKNYDVIHLHAGPFCYPYLYYAKKAGIKKRIVHAHSISSGNNRLSSLRNEILLFPMKRLATHYIACSKEAANNWFDRRNIKTYTIINNGVMLDRFKYSVDDRKVMRKKLGIEDQQTVFLHISNMSPLKNIPFLIEVFYRISAELKDSVLILVGKNNLSDEIANMITQYGLKDRIINFGVTDNVVSLINCADVSLMPSKSEGFGLVAIECQSCKKNIIISDGFPKVIDATNYVSRLPLKEELWVEKALQIVQTIQNVADEDTEGILKQFDIVEITKELQRLYRGGSEAIDNQ